MYIDNDEAQNFLPPSVSAFPQGEMEGVDHAFVTCNAESGCTELWGLHYGIASKFDDYLRREGWTVDGERHYCPKHTFEAYVAYQQELEETYRRGLTKKQLLEYRRWQGELQDCPACGAVDVEVESDCHPDMIGTTYSTTFGCCGFSRCDYNSALEYDENGTVVDVK